MSPLVFAVGRREIVSDLTILARAEFALDLAAPLNYQRDVLENVCLKQRGTLVVVEVAVEINCFDVKVEVGEQSKKLSETSLAVSPSVRRRTVKVYRLLFTQA
ncbi:hypothetical protein C493_17151 [Natronolimnohabitans innermongolicus JCM 12255]|uniref:Uncharacterized protein n=1 Tax=Natronolimnohabitans innermongolicus JCM 12255 TaxID=1227499 RepID=L9WTL9_9EURY|nr:hypothetical protein C493_17151 [Natronolimnohabitans innermongolicus JCM 12255]